MSRRSRLLPWDFLRRSLERVGDVVALRDASRRYRRSVGAAGLWRFLGPLSPLGFDVGLLVGVQENPVELLFLELLPGVSMAVDLGGVSLPSTSGADVLAFPLSCAHSVVGFVVVLSHIVQEILLGSDGEPVDHGVHARHATRYYHRLLRLVGCIDPARELDYAVVEGTDVDGALAQDRVVTERFEHALLELFGRLERALVVVVVRALVFFVFIFRRVAGLSSAKLFANTVGESANSAVMLSDNDSCGESGQCAER